MSTSSNVLSTGSTKHDERSILIWKINFTFKFMYSLYVPKTNPSIGDSAFSVIGPCLWNKLPISIRVAGSLIVFKDNLKPMHLFSYSTKKALGKCRRFSELAWSNTFREQKKDLTAFKAWPASWLHSQDKLTYHSETNSS